PPPQRTGDKTLWNGPPSAQDRLFSEPYPEPARPHRAGRDLASRLPACRPPRFVRIETPKRSRAEGSVEIIAHRPPVEPAAERQSFSSIRLAECDAVIHAES